MLWEPRERTAPLPKRLADVAATVHSLVYDSCIATKTITLELDAYDKLKRAKRGPRESFSSVVRRARWDDSVNAGEVLERLRALYRLRPGCFLPEDVLDAIEERARKRERRPRVGAAET